MSSKSMYAATIWRGKVLIGEVPVTYTKSRYRIIVQDSHMAPAYDWRTTINKVDNDCLFHTYEEALDALRGRLYTKYVDTQQAQAEAVANYFLALKKS